MQRRKNDTVSYLLFIRNNVTSIILTALLLVLSQPSASLAVIVSTGSNLSLTGAWSGSFRNEGETLSDVNAHVNANTSYDHKLEAPFPYPQIAPPVSVSSFVADIGASATTGGTTPVSVPDALATSTAEALVSSPGNSAYSSTYLSGDIRADANQTVDLTLDYSWNSEMSTGVGYLFVGFLSDGPFNLLLASKNGFTPVTFTYADGSPYLTGLINTITNVTSGTDTVSWTLPVVKDHHYAYFTGVTADTDGSVGTSLPPPGSPPIIIHPGNGPGPVPGPVVAFVPEPTALVLVSTGLLGLAGLRRRVSS